MFGQRLARVSSWVLGACLLILTVAPVFAIPERGGEPPSNRWTMVVNGEAYNVDWDNPIQWIGGVPYWFPELRFLRLIGADRTYYSFADDVVWVGGPTNSVGFYRSGDAAFWDGRRMAGWGAIYDRGLNPNYTLVPLNILVESLGGLLVTDEHGVAHVSIVPQLTRTPAEACDVHGLALETCLGQILLSDVYRTFGYEEVRKAVEHPGYGDGSGLMHLMNQIAIDRQGARYNPNAEWARIGTELIATFFAFEFGAVALSTVGWATDPAYMVRMQRMEAAYQAEQRMAAGTGARVRGSDGFFRASRGIPANSARFQAQATGKESTMRVLRAPDRSGQGGLYELEEYRYGGYEFDDALGERAAQLQPTVLVDTKGGIYQSWFRRDGVIYDVFLNSSKGVRGFYVQAQQQVQAANGIPIRWIWQDERIAEVTRRYILQRPDGAELMSRIEFVIEQIPYMIE